MEHLFPLASFDWEPERVVEADAHDRVKHGITNGEEKYVETFPKISCRSVGDRHENKESLASLTSSYSVSV